MTQYWGIRSSTCNVTYQANMERLCLSFIQNVAMPLKSIMNATRANTTGCVDSFARRPLQMESCCSSILRFAGPFRL
jgi:hypothetical protein